MQCELLVAEEREKQRSGTKVFQEAGVNNRMYKHYDIVTYMCMCYGVFQIT